MNKLNTIHWKSKRKKILKRDDYKCTACGSRKGLVVHHSYYYEDRIDPWKYPNKSLLTLCEKCHNQYHKYCEVEIKPNPQKPSIKTKRFYKNLKVKRKRQKQISLAEYQEIRGLRIKERRA